MIQPLYLKKGDTIAIVAPSGIIKDHTTIHKAVALIQSWGLNAVLGKHIFDNENHFSSTDENRLTDIQEALDNPNIKAIWCARGGYGTVRIIDAIDFTAFLKKPKWIIGYSDITVLHNHIHNIGVATLHGMMPVNLSASKEKIKQSIDTLYNTLFGKEIRYEFPNSKYNVLGNAEGLLVGGNLTLLENSLGTNSTINTKDKILFIEEIGEYKYHIDRMLWALKRNHYFKNCKGLLVGGMTEIKQNDPVFGQTIEDLILKIVAEYNIPVAFDFPAGHDLINTAIYLGIKIKLDINKESTTLNYIY